MQTHKRSPSFRCLMWFRVRTMIYIHIYMDMFYIVKNSFYCQHINKISALSTKPLRSSKQNPLKPGTSFILTCSYRLSNLVLFIGYYVWGNGIKRITVTQALSIRADMFVVPKNYLVRHCEGGRGRRQLRHRTKWEDNIGSWTGLDPMLTNSRPVMDRPGVCQVLERKKESLLCLFNNASRAHWFSYHWLLGRQACGHGDIFL